VIGARSLEEMVMKLKKPRRVMILVKAGSAVDDFIHKLACIFIVSFDFAQANYKAKLYQHHCLSPDVLDQEHFF